MCIILPVGVDYQARRWPVVTFTLMGINTVVHMASMVMRFNNEEWYEGQPERQPLRGVM